MKQKRRPRPMDLRLETQRKTVARLMLIGWTAEKIARKLHCTARSLRYAVASPEFAILYAELERERLTMVDRLTGNLLIKAVLALDRQLNHPDPWVRADAIDKALKIHGRYIEKVDLTGRLTHTGDHDHVLGIIPEEAMTDEQRDLTRKLLMATGKPKMLPPGLQQPTEDGQ
jgi:hypothetical protein